MFSIEHKVPIIEPHPNPRNYRVIPVNREDARFHEPLIPLDSVNIAYESYYAKTGGKNPPFCRVIEGSRPDAWLRKTLAEKLVKVNQTLHPFGVELFVFDAYRTIECQQGIANFHYENAQRKFSDATEKAWMKDASLYAFFPSDFDPLDSTTWPPHTTGAAVDLTIRSLASGELIDMGSNLEEIVDARATDYFERLLLKGLINEDDSRLQHRRLLYWAMSQEDIINDPLVYWHHDWGNQLYIRDRKVVLSDTPEVAWYGYIAPPPLPKID